MWEKLSQAHRLEAMSDSNLYFTAQALLLGPSEVPTRDQAITHYFLNTGPHYTVIEIMEKSESEETQSIAA